MTVDMWNYGSLLSSDNKQQPSSAQCLLFAFKPIKPSLLSKHLKHLRLKSTFLLRIWILLPPLGINYDYFISKMRLLLTYDWSPFPPLYTSDLNLSLHPILVHLNLIINILWRLICSCRLPDSWVLHCLITQVKPNEIIIFSKPTPERLLIVVDCGYTYDVWLVGMGETDRRLDTILCCIKQTNAHATAEARQPGIIAPAATGNKTSDECLYTLYCI